MILIKLLQANKDSMFIQEKVNLMSRYYVETGGSRYYLKALPNGDITTLAVPGSATDSGTLFRHVIG